MEKKGESVVIRVCWPKGTNLDYPAKDELRPFLPPGAVQLNYGQGAGQIRIGDSVWGIYCSAGNAYTLQFEEGQLSPAEFIAALESIGAVLDSYFDVPADIRLVGALSGREPSELYLEPNP